MKTASGIIAATLCGSSMAFVPSNTASKTTALNLKVGETAPDFSLVDQNGKTFTRSKNKKPLVVYFYPADSTPGCTVQAKKFQEEIKSIRKQYRADVVGISGQGSESKQKFAQELGLDFSILADEGDAVRNSFKVPKAAFGFLPGRVTYVLDKDGVCTSVCDNLADAASHIDAAKGALEEMGASSKKSPFALF
mmetsp:Transcript_7323/g.15047  ORF Transcript_7323/g.15047 Transcript_7323/m.15047 type:complete len:193 (+) Transcript_7323:99-677(+)